jgi:hypothetical protein
VSLTNGDDAIATQDPGAVNYRSSCCWVFQSTPDRETIVPSNSAQLKNRNVPGSSLQYINDTPTYPAKIATNLAMSRHLHSMRAAAAQSSHTTRYDYSYCTM